MSGIMTPGHERLLYPYLRAPCLCMLGSEAIDFPIQISVALESLSANAILIRTISWQTHLTGTPNYQSIALKGEFITETDTLQASEAPKQTADSCRCDPSDTLNEHVLSPPCPYFPSDADGKFKSCVRKVGVSDARGFCYVTET